MWFISPAYIGLVILLIVYDSGPILGDRPVFPGSFCMHAGQSQRQLLTNCCLLALQSCIAMAMAGGGGGYTHCSPSLWAWSRTVRRGAWVLALPLDLRVRRCSVWRGVVSFGPAPPLRAWIQINQHGAASIRKQKKGSARYVYKMGPQLKYGPALA